MDSKYRKLYSTDKVNYLTIKHLGNDYYKCALIKFQRYEKNFKKTTGTNEKKLANNLSRAKSKIFELALCNEWSLFFTGTISPQKFDRTNFKDFYKKFSKWLNNYNYQNNYNIKFLIIPELHLDGKSWHMHGLINGLPLNKLMINKFGFLEWEDYSKNFGFCSFSMIYESYGIACYVVKYISKEVTKTNLSLNKHIFYHSKGLKCAETIFKGSCYGIDNFFDFENDYCKIKNLKSTEEFKNFFKNCKFIEEI